MEIRRLDTSELDLLDPLIQTYGFKPHRNYRICSRRRQNLVLRAEIETTLKNPDGGALLATNGDQSAAVVFRKLGWDSAFFGVPMGRVDYVLRENDASAELLSAALDACADACRARGIHHLSARVDVADGALVEALEGHGYTLKDSLVTYIYHPKKDPPPVVREMGDVRPFAPGDAGEVIEIAREAYQGFRSRFSADRHIPADRADALYVEWARRCCTGEMADVCFVTANARGGLNGFVAVRKVEPISTVGGTVIFGGGLGACRREAPGAYAGLARASCHFANERGAVAEGQTQIHNFTTVRVYETIGMEYVRADYTFHAWLGQ